MFQLSRIDLVLMFSSKTCCSKIQLLITFVQANEKKQKITFVLRSPKISNKQSVCKKERQFIQVLIYNNLSHLELFLLVNLVCLFQVPPFVFFFMCCASYRIHSIYILRMFNDPIASLLLYVAVDLFLRNRWSLGCLLFRYGKFIIT